MMPLVRSVETRELMAGGMGESGDLLMASAVGEGEAHEKEGKVLHP